MFHNAKSGTVTVGGIPMDYVVFGKGQSPLVILPGLSDGLKTVRGQAVTLAMYYKQFAKLFTVYIFSRKNVIVDGYSTKDMAKDQKLALDNLGIDNFYLMGISQGGMIAQHIAINYPAAVKKLVIGVSASRPNNTIRGVLPKWISFAENNDYKSLMIDTSENSYSQKTLKKYRLMYPLLTRLGRPSNFSRFLIQANACLSHDTYNALGQIKCPTLIIGGSDDKIVGIHASKEMAERINESKLIVYEGLGHAAYEEGKDFNQQVINFFSNS